MLLGIDWSGWLPVVTAALIVLTVVVGVRGLYQDHTKDGKLTRAGWGVAAAMVVLGILTFLSGLLDQRIAAEKERTEAAEREERFQRQMSALRGVTGTLRGVTGSLSDLQAGMQDSLSRQRELFGKADENLKLGAGLQEQARANTTSVLRRVFQESNRIAGERIQVMIQYFCPGSPILRPLLQRDELNSDYVVLTIRGPKQGRSGLTLQSTAPNYFSDGLVFSGFVEDLKEFETFPMWRDSRVTVRLSASRPVLSISDTIAGYELSTKTTRPSCSSQISLLLNGRRVMVEPFELVEHQHRHYTGEVQDVRIDNNRLPQF